MSVRVRFAPSPGYLSLGGARVAIVNRIYTLDRGKFLLRIDDTDKQKSLPRRIEQTRKSLDWLGIKCDGEVRQSDRREFYRRYAEALIDLGKAYACFCPPIRRNSHPRRRKKGSRCSGRCRCLPPEEAERRRKTELHAVRLRIPAGKDGEAEFHDLLRGRRTIKISGLKDEVILRRGGEATYNFACAVDDIDMGITHVIRGEDHLAANTGRQVFIIQALEKKSPVYVHLPIITDSLGAKASKSKKKPSPEANDAELAVREVSLKEHMNSGTPPKALYDYLATLNLIGIGDRSVPVDLQTRIQDLKFNSRKIQFDRHHLEYFARRHILGLSTSELTTILSEFATQRFKNLDAELKTRAVAVVRNCGSRKYGPLAALAETVTCGYPDARIRDRAQAMRFDQETSKAIGLFQKCLPETEWSIPAVRDLLDNIAKDPAARRELGVAVQVALCSCTPADTQNLEMVLATVQTISKDDALARLDAYLKFTSKLPGLPTGANNDKPTEPIDLKPMADMPVPTDSISRPLIKVFLSYRLEILSIRTTS